MGKVSRVDDLPEIQGGRTLGFVGSSDHTDLLSPTFEKDWFEWDDRINQWVTRANGGVMYVGLVSDQVRVLTLDGFGKADTNVKFEERRGPIYTVNGRETYWSADSLYFLY